MSKCKACRAMVNLHQLKLASCPGLYSPLMEVPLHQRRRQNAVAGYYNQLSKRHGAVWIVSKLEALVG